MLRFDLGNHNTDTHGDAEHEAVLQEEAIAVHAGDNHSIMLWSQDRTKSKHRTFHGVRCHDASGIWLAAADYSGGS